VEQRFYSSDVLKITGYKRSRFAQLVGYDFIRPSIQKSTGPGEQNIFSRHDLYSIRLFQLLTDEITLQREYASAFVATVDWHAAIKDRYQYLMLVERGSGERKCYFAHSPETVGLEDAEWFLVIRCDRIINFVDRGVDEL